MSFLYPIFLYGLIAVSIPIIIHFFNFRRYKTIYYSNIKLLQDVKSDAKTKSVLKDLLVLLMRILALIALVLAFTQPYIPVSEETGNMQEYSIGIYIDNSFSTQAENQYGKIIETQKNAVLNIADAYPDNQIFFFLNNDFNQKYSIPVSKEQLKEFVLETEPEPFFRKTTEIISQFKKNIGNFSDKKTNKILIYYISDFQKTSTDIYDLKSDSLLNLVFIPSKINKTSNISIDSVWFDNPNRNLSKPDVLNVSITNKSNEKFYNMPLNLYLNDTLKTPSSFNINENQSIIKTLDFINSRTGIINGRVEISDFPIVFDNTFYFSYKIARKKNVLIIEKNNTNKFINAIFEGDSFFEITHYTEDNIKVSEFKNFDVIFIDGLKEISSGLSQELVSYCYSGGTIIFFPDFNSDIHNVNSFLSDLNTDFILSKDSTLINIGKVNFESSVFQNVFENTDLKIEMPKINKRFVYSDKSLLEQENILVSEKNEKILTKYKINLGEIYLFATGADENSGNLVYSPLWPPIIYNAVIYSDRNTRIYYTIGKNEAINISSKSQKNDDKVIHIINKEYKIDIIPQIVSRGNNNLKLFTSNSITKSGNYSAQNGNNIIQAISFNYDRQESDISSYTTSELKSILDKINFSKYNFYDAEDKFISNKITKNYKGYELYQYFIIAVLLFIVIEMLIIKFIK